MTIVAEMPVAIKCPSCGHEVPMTPVCAYCGFPLKTLHQHCGICKKKVGHGRHYGPHGLAYYCGCSFACTTRRELEEHLKEVR